jgi:drug/metabolite transporter (DMT)-like permease
VSILAALSSAACIGAADFLGAWTSRAASPLIVALWINIVALLALGVLCGLSHPQLSSGAAGGAVLGGIVSAIAINLIYAALAAGAMSLIAPLVACGTSGIPVVTAIVLGHAPHLLEDLGIVLSLGGMLAITWEPAARVDRVSLTRSAIALSAAASVAAGTAFVILQQSVAGGSHVVVGVAALSRLCAVIVCFVLVAAGRRSIVIHGPVKTRVLTAGLLEAGGITLFLAGTALGSNAVVAVIVSLYAIVTVFLAQTVLGERVSVQQGLGILAAVAGVALLSTA